MSSKIKPIIIIILFLFLPTVLYANFVTLKWDHVISEIPIDGYKLFMRQHNQTYDYSSPVWVGTSNTYTINNLTSNTGYYFVVRAYRGLDESSNSNEVYWYNYWNEPDSKDDDVNWDYGENSGDNCFIKSILK